VVCWKAFQYDKDDECISMIEGRGASLSVLLEIFPGRREFSQMFVQYIFTLERSRTPDSTKGNSAGDLENLRELLLCNTSYTIFISYLS